MLKHWFSGLLITVNLLWLTALYYPAPIWWLDNLLSYPIWLVGFNALIFFIALLLRKKIPLLSSALCGLILLWLMPSHQSQARPLTNPNREALTHYDEGQCPSSLKVIQFNAFYENTDYNRLLNVLLQEQADLVVIQEVAPALEDKLSTLDDIYPYIYGGKTHAKMPSSQLMLSKKAILNFSVEAFTEKNAILRGDWPIGPQQVLHLIASHLPSPRNPTLWNERNSMLSHVENLANHITINTPDAHVLVLGDFNLSSMSARFKQHFSDFQTQPVASWPEWLNHYPTPAFSMISIDHLWLKSPQLSLCQRAGRLPSLGSDHRMVITQLTSDTIFAEVSLSKNTKQYRANSPAPR